MLILSLKNALIYVTEIQHSTENLALYIPKLLYSLSLSQTWIFLIFLTPVAIPVIQHCEFGNQRNTSHMELFFFIIGVLYQIYQPISNLTYSFLVRHTIFGHLP